MSLPNPYGGPDAPFVNKGTGQCVPIFSVASTTPANATVYYFGSDTISTTPTVYQMAFVKSPITGILKGVFLKVRMVAGSGELVQHFVRINDLTDIALPSIAYNANSVDLFAAGLNTPVNAGDQLAIKILTPTWSVAPTTVRPCGYIYIE